MKKIVNQWKQTKRVPVEKLVPLQGALKKITKENMRKLKAEIAREGFTEPVTAWDDGKTLYILNGHQRVAALKELIEDGFACASIPVNVIAAKNANDAKRKLLGLASQFGEVTDEGFAEFIKDAELEATKILDDLRFPELKGLKDKDRDIDDGGDEGEEETDQTRPIKKIHVLFSFPPDKLAAVTPILNRMLENDFVEYEQSGN